MKDLTQKMIVTAVSIALPILVGIAAEAPQSEGTNPPGAQPSTAHTQAQNAKVFSELDFQIPEEAENAGYGLVAKPTQNIMLLDKTVWDFSAYDFEKAQPPTTADEYKTYSVNPSLWRQAQLNNNYGLFNVTDPEGKNPNNPQIFQIRGYDLANMTIVEGQTGLILVDTLTSEQTAKAAMAFYNEQRGNSHYGKTPEIKAIIYSHSHIDHYGGVGGLIKASDTLADKGNKAKVLLIAPSGFLEHAVSENVFAGNAMSRHATYMYGTPLPNGVLGQVDAGLGKRVSAGIPTIIAPNVSIDNDTFAVRPCNVDALKSSDLSKPCGVDGVTLEFQLTPNTEAPSEMTVYFPDFKALDMAELACPLMHNLLTMRGSQVRSSQDWAHYLTQSLERYGDKAEVVLGQHNWPHWKNQSIREYLASQRDLYQYIHDQSLRLANEGYSMNDLAEMVVLPESLKKPWFLQGYYGSLKHNVKAVYQMYLGWYDGNPALLDPLADVAAAKKYVEYMGGVGSVIAKAQKDFASGNYRWVAQVMNQAIFAYPDNKPAKLLQAKALEQLGYQAEAATWRNAYLMGAKELRNGIKVGGGSTVTPSTLEAMTVPMYFEFLGIRLNGPKATGNNLSIKWNIVDCDTDQKDMCGNFVTVVENSALTYLSKSEFPRLYSEREGKVDVSVQLTRKELNCLMVGQSTIDSKSEGGTPKAEEELFKLCNVKDKIVVGGNKAAVIKFYSLLDTFHPDFPLVTPIPVSTTEANRNLASSYRALRN